MRDISIYRESIIKALESEKFKGEPESLYEPVNYILSLGGKKLRPVLTLLAADLFGGDYSKALPAAVAVEVFHNFSLVHDDIMDDAPLRRGKETVHVKWNLNTGILSGDAMLILAYQFFERYEPHTFKALAQLFSKTALQVCEGQQWDIDFETRQEVQVAEYIKMIEYKTAVLVGAALKMGAIVAEALHGDCEEIYQFGINLGIAFQLQDDYLDAFGDPETFGKQSGGDIIENKKTYLYIMALNSASPEEAAVLSDLYGSQPDDPAEKIEQVKSLFISAGAEKLTLTAIREYTDKALTNLERLSVPENNKAVLRSFSEMLMNRKV